MLITCARRMLIKYVKGGVDNVCGGVLIKNKRGVLIKCMRGYMMVCDLVG